jgi:hypothetical protein
MVMRYIVAAVAAAGALASSEAMACHSGTAGAHARGTHGQGQHSQAAAPVHQGRKVAGVINKISGKKVTVTHQGAKGKQQVSAVIDSGTQVLKGEKAASVADLQENQNVIVQFAEGSDEAVSIEIVPTS